MGNSLPCQGLRFFNKKNAHNGYTTSEGMTFSVIPSVLEIWDWYKKKQRCEFLSHRCFCITYIIMYNPLYHSST